VNHQRPVLPGDALGNVETSGADNVILLLCDGLGYNEWTRQSGRGFIGSISAKGSVRPITTVFPSTTAAALTTVSTGLTPQEHGLPEWYVYMDEVGDTIATLPFARVGDRGRDTLEGELNPKALFSGKTIFQKLRDEGIVSTSLTNRTLAYTAYSTVSRVGSEVLPYSTASDFTVSLRRLVERSRGKNFFYAYWSLVDTIEHIYGPKTDESEVEASLISHAFREGFLSKLDREAEEDSDTRDRGPWAVASGSERNRLYEPVEEAHQCSRAVPVWRSDTSVGERPRRLPQDPGKPTGANEEIPGEEARRVGIRHDDRGSHRHGALRD